MTERISSRLFGDRFPYPLDGKFVLKEVATAFANEFNQAAKKNLSAIGAERVEQWIDLTVTTAYPTARQHCPRIAIVRQGLVPRLAGLGGEIETRRVQLETGEVGFRVFKGQVMTDTLEVTICTLNEQMRDDLFLWFQQYMLDAIYWMLPQLPSVYNLQCLNAVDDQVEYQGSASQPGFEFYAGRMTFQVQYDQIVIEGVDILESIVNWQQCLYANQQ